MSAKIISTVKAFFDPLWDAVNGGKRIVGDKPAITYREISHDEGASRNDIKAVEAFEKEGTFV